MIISLHPVRSTTPDSPMRCEPIPTETTTPAEQAIIIPAPPVLLIACALRAHRSGRLNAMAADRLIGRLLASGDPAARAVAGFLLARQHRLPDASPSDAGPAAINGSPLSDRNSSIDRRSS